MKAPLSVKIPAAAGQPSDQQLRIRAFPYPYRAALAICNDLDGIASFAQLKAIHDVLNGSKMTPCGPGLGLEVSDSLHFFSVHPQQDDTFAYFSGKSGKPVAEAPLLREAIRSGLLDTLHSWGNFSQKGGFFRHLALRAVRELEKYQLRIPVWTNHGDRHNFQNLGRSDSLGDVRETASQRGDKSQVLEYCADLVRKIGVRYIWIRELTQIPGQERRLNWKDCLADHQTCRWDFPGMGIKSGAGGRSFLPWQLSNQLLRPVTLRDGSVFYEILRYGSFRSDGSDNLPQLLSLQVLRHLVECGGSSLLYVHLGKGRPSPERPFSRESYQALARLAQWAHSGEIWVTTPSRLCRYVELRRHLKLRARHNIGVLQVSGCFEQELDLPPPAVEGLSFYAPAAPSCHLQIGARKIMAVANPPDHTGKISYSLPLEPVPYCWE